VSNPDLPKRDDIVEFTADHGDCRVDTEGLVRQVYQDGQGDWHAVVQVDAIGDTTIVPTKHLWIKPT
jgi:hypothetical protein